MNVVIKIDCREAIPVRALPFLSDRKTMSPDVVARALAGTEQNGRFVGLRAYRVEHGVVTPIAERWWQTGPCQKLDALSATLSAEERPSEHETEDEYQARHNRELAKWRDKSPGLLPAGAFVFKDEFEQLYRNEFKFGYYRVKGADGQWLSELNHDKRIALDYSPFVDDPAIAALVMAGFESYITPEAGNVRQTIPQRNARWLAQVDKAQAGPTKPSDTTIFKQIESAEGIGWETVKKAVTKAKKDREKQYREGNVKPLARGKKDKPDLNSVWGNRIGK